MLMRIAGMAYLLLISVALCIAGDFVPMMYNTNTMQTVYGGTTNAPQTNVVVNYLYYNNTTNYIFQSADLTNSYITRCSNGVVNVKTNSLLP